MRISKKARSKVWRRRLLAMPCDKYIEGVWFHATGFEICFSNPSNPRNWWNEYISEDGEYHYYGI